MKEELTQKILSTPEMQKYIAMATEISKDPKSGFEKYKEPNYRDIIIVTEKEEVKIKFFMNLTDEEKVKGLTITQCVFNKNKNEVELDKVIYIRNYKHVEASKSKIKEKNYDVRFLFDANKEKTGDISLFRMQLSENTDYLNILIKNNLKLEVDNDLESEHDDVFKSTLDWCMLLEDINNVDINKYLIEMFLFDKNLTQEEKDILILNHDLDIENIENMRYFANNINKSTDHDITAKSNNKHAL